MPLLPLNYYKTQSIDNQLLILNRTISLSELLDEREGDRIGCSSKSQETPALPQPLRYSCTGDWGLSPFRI